MGLLTAPEQRDVRSEAQTHSQLEDAAVQGQAVIDAGGDFKGMSDIAINALRDWEYMGVANMLADAVYSKDERRVRGQMGSAIGNWRKNLSGTQVTGIEMVLGADWDPTASGITSQESIDRARRLQGFINTNREVLNLPALGAATGGKGGLSSSAMKYYGG